MDLDGLTEVVKRIVTDTYYLTEALYKTYQAVVPTAGASVEQETRTIFLERLKRFKQDTLNVTTNLEEYAATGNGKQEIVSSANSFRDAINGYKSHLKDVIEPRSVPDAETKKNMKTTYDLVLTVSNELMAALRILKQKEKKSIPMGRERAGSREHLNKNLDLSSQKRGSKSTYEFSSHPKETNAKEEKTPMLKDESSKVTLDDIQALSQECTKSLEMLSHACESAVRGDNNSAIEGLRSVMTFLKDMNRIAKSLGLDLQCDMLQRLSSEMVLSIKTTLKQGADAASFEKVLKNKEGTTRHIHLLLRDINAEFQRQQEEDQKKQLQSPLKSRPNSLSSFLPTRTVSETSVPFGMAGGSGGGGRSMSYHLSQQQKQRQQTIVPPQRKQQQQTTNNNHHHQQQQQPQQSQSQLQEQQEQIPPSLPPVLLIQENEAAAKKILMWYRSHRRRNLWWDAAKKIRTDASTKKLRKKRETFKEVIGSEMTYVKGLEQCVKIVMGGMKEEKIWKDQQYQEQMVEKIFLNYEEVAKLSRTLLNKLVARDKEFPLNVKIGDLFLEMMDGFLKQYAVYVQGYYQTVEFIDTIENKKWAEFLKRKRNEANKPLVSLLILPVQRLPRYEMLLEQIYDLTPADHVDKESLRLAVKFVKEMNENIDRQTQNRNKLLSVEKLIVGCPNIAVFDRYFIRQGAIQGVSRKGKRVNYYLFLFNNMMLITSPLEKSKKEEKYEFIEELNLPSYELQDYYYHKQKFVLSPVKKEKDVIKKKDEIQPVTLFSDSKENWMIDIGTWTVRTVAVTDR